MGEGPRSDQAAGAAGDDNAGNNRGNNDDAKQRGRRNRQRTNKPKWKEGGNNNQASHIPKEKFVGGSEDLKGFIYDVAISKGGVAYTKTTKEIARYMGEKYNTTGSYIRTAILTLQVPALSRPIAPAARGTPPVIDPVDQESFKEKTKKNSQVYYLCAAARSENSTPPVTCQPGHDGTTQFGIQQPRFAKRRY
jgi:hypothetical protein